MSRISSSNPQEPERLRQVLRLVGDLTGSDDLSNLRIADLGCFTGAFAIELALHGAEVVGIEGREASIERARFAARTHNLSRCTFVLDDVRNFSESRYGRFDFVLCLGILYHLDALSIFGVLDRVGEATDRAAVIDTLISIRGRRVVTHHGTRFFGERQIEHHQSDSASDRESKIWSSLNNTESFVLTRPSLYDALHLAGFTSIFECHWPQSSIGRSDRIQLLGLKGGTVDVLTFPEAKPISSLYEIRRDTPIWKRAYGFVRSKGAATQAWISRSWCRSIG